MIWPFKKNHDAEMLSMLENIQLRLRHQDGRLELFMSQISDFADRTEANFEKIRNGIAALDKQIQDFQNSPGTLSPEDQARLDKIVAASDKLATAAEAPVTPNDPNA